MNAIEPGNQAQSGCLRLVHLTCQAHAGDANVGVVTLPESYLIHGCYSDWEINFCYS